MKTMKRDDIYFEAMKARDHRFDGKFFVGVKTTGIYCRPICPARPKRENVEFFESRLAAERAGYRPCLRCRPESAPLSPAWIGKSAVVQRAIKMLHSKETIEFDEDSFASLFGVTARHLRRLFIEEIGKTPKQLSYENRLNLARKLITETALPITEISFAAGFSSIRRFNDAFKERFKKSPREIRRSKVKESDGIRLTLPYRPPFDFDGLLRSYRNHRVGDLEYFDDQSMTRIIFINGHAGEVRVSNDSKNFFLNVDIFFPDTSVLHAILMRVRHLFDLNSDPVVVANSLETHPQLKKLLKSFPGIRLPSGWDPFEVAIATILGQLVSVERGRALVSDLINIAGSEIVWNRKQLRLFPTPQQIVDADLGSLKTTRIRKQTLIEFAKAIRDKRLSLEPTQDVNEFIKEITKIKGVGPWTAQYIALKALRHTDAFPESDLILARVLATYPKGGIETIRPWRGYAAALLWRASVPPQTNTKRSSL